MSIYKQRAIDEVVAYSATSPYTYDLNTIVNRTSKMKIICKLHGEYLQEVRKHLNGQQCPRCAAIESNSVRKKSTEDFIVEAVAVHDNLYSYENTTYVDAHTKLHITCSLHGDFLQAPFKHLQGQGCRHCTKAYHNLEWFSSNLDKAYLEGSLYLVRLYNDTEEFYKVGVSESSIARRFSNLTTYNVEVLDVVTTTRIASYILEQFIHKTTDKTLKYKPQIKFVGHTECYTQPINIRNMEWNNIDHNTVRLH